MKKSKFAIPKWIIRIGYFILYLIALPFIALYATLLAIVNLFTVPFLARVTTIWFGDIELEDNYEEIIQELKE